jgi:hypothetical protein
VEPQATAQFKTAAYFLPKETDHVTVIVEQVDFADATQWKPGPGPDK